MKTTRLQRLALALLVILGAAAAPSVAAASATSSAAASCAGHCALPPLMLTGTVGGPGFSPYAQPVVFATINDSDTHHGKATIEHASLGKPVWVSAGGHFILSVPADPALVNYAEAHRGWANLYVIEMSTSGANAIVSVPIKRTTQGGFAVANLDPTLPTTVDIKLPALGAGQRPIRAVAAPSPSPLLAPVPAAGNAVVTTLNQVTGCTRQVADGGCDPTTVCTTVQGCLPRCYNRQVSTRSDNFPTTIGEYHSWVSYQTTSSGQRVFNTETATIDYTHAATSQIDVGFSYDGSNWAIQSSHMFVNTTSNGVGYTTNDLQGEGAEFMPVFTYEEWDANERCNFPPYIDQTVHLGYTVEANDCCAGTQFGIDKSFLDGQQQYANHAAEQYTFWDRTSADKNKGSTDRYQYAANAFGFNVGLTSTYDSSTNIHWSFNPSYQGARRQIYYLWGTKDEKTIDLAATVAAYTKTNEYEPALSPTVTAPLCYGDICER